MESLSSSDLVILERLSKIEIGINSIIVRLDAQDKLLVSSIASKRKTITQTKGLTTDTFLPDVATIPKVKKAIKKSIKSNDSDNEHFSENEDNINSENEDNDSKISLPIKTKKGKKASSTSTIEINDSYQEVILKPIVKINKMIFFKQYIFEQNYNDLRKNYLEEIDAVLSSVKIKYKPNQEKYWASVGNHVWKILTPQKKEIIDKIYKSWNLKNSKQESQLDKEDSE